MGRQCQLSNLHIWMRNACVKFEERSLNPSQFIALTTKLGCGGGCGRRRGGGGCVADENNIIFPKTYVSREYNYTKDLGGLSTHVCSIFRHEWTKTPHITMS